MSNSIGNKIKITIFGQSHSEAIGCVIEGLPAGIELDFDYIQKVMDRRAPGKSRLTTPRREEDVPKILSGIVDGKTCGAPLSMIIENKDTRSKDYSELSDKPRPGHADYPAYVKTGGSNDIRGGGQFSGRLTAPICFAGAICSFLLEKRGIYIGSHVLSIGNVKDRGFDYTDINIDELIELKNKELPTLDNEAEAAMRAEILKASNDCDSVGGVIECAIVGLPVGIGQPMFEGVENNIAKAIFGIPAVRGIEFGAGFAAAKMRGSEHNDPYCIKDGKVITKTNNNGGVTGGMTNGMPVLFKVAIKPTPSIAIEQQTISLSDNADTTLRIKGRHDPCIVPRALPVVESVAAITVLNLLMEE